MKIGIGSDHGGFALKEELKAFMEEKNIEVIDFGTHNTASVDYPDYGEAVAKAVINGEVERGVVICGTGIGISISANKVKGIRCALCGDVYSAKMSMAHNNANMIALGGRVLGVGLAKEILSAYLNWKFQAGRHERRVDKISEIEARFMV